jgi:uncharacterized membrane protein YhfC
MKMRGRTVVRIIWALIVLGLLGGWLIREHTSPSDKYELSFACDGGPDEEQFLFEQSDTVVEEGTRRILSDNGFVVYRIPVDNANLGRVFVNINQVGFHLKFSPDGSSWSPLMHFAELESRNPDLFQTQSCGFGDAQKEATTRTGTAYLRFGPPSRPRKPYPAIRSLKLHVSGPAPDEHFYRYSMTRMVMALLPARLMILVGLIPVIVLRKWWKTPWRLFGAGALLWTVSVAAKAGFAIPTNDAVSRMAHAVLPTFPADVTFWAYIGLLTGLFECGIFLLVATFIRRRQWSWHDAVSLGVGFGAMEAIALGVAAAVSISQSVNTGVTGATAFSLLGPAERLIALAVHTASVAMIVHALRQRRWRWFVASFLYKSGIDAVAAFVILAGTGLMSARPWFVELVLFGPFAYAGIFILAALRRIWDATDIPATSGDTGPVDGGVI